MKLTHAERTKRERIKADKTVTRFTDRIEKRAAKAHRKFERLLSDALNALYAFDDLRNEMDDFESEDTFDIVHKAVEKRFNAVYADVEHYDEQSEFYDAVNELHSKAIGVLE